MKYIKGLLITCIILVLLYLVINFGVLLWFWIDPNGFWGFLWFYTLFTGLFYILYIGLLAFAGFFTGKKGWKRLLYGVLFGVLAMGLFGIELAPVYFINKKLSDKYSHIKKSAKYFKQGKYEKAYDYSSELYEQSHREYNRKFWFLRHLFLSTESGQDFLNERQYEFKINYAFCLSRLRLNLDEAESVFKECERIARESFPEKADYLLLPLGGLSNLYYDQGEILKSERLNNEMSRLVHSLEEQDRVFMVNTMLIRVLHLQRYGDYEKAHQTIQQALALYDVDEKESTSGTFLQLALVGVQSHLLRGEPEDAGKLISMAKPIAKKRKKNLVYLEFLTLKAHLLEAKGEVDNAEDLFEEVVDRSRKKSDVIYSKELMRLAGFYFRQNKYQDALTYFSRAMEESSGNADGLWFREKHELGRGLLHFALGDTEKALSSLKTRDALLLNNADQYLRVLDVGEQEKYSLKVQKRFQVANALYIAMQDSSLFGRIYDNVLFTKSLAFFSNRHIERFLDKTQNKELKNQLTSIRTRKKGLEEQSLKEFKKDNRLQRKIDSLILAERTFLDELAAIKGYSPYSVSKISWQDVRNSLDSTEVAVEFAHYSPDPLNPGDEKFYALILDNTSLQPELLSLFPAKELNEILTKRGTLKEHVNSLYAGEKRELIHNLIWKPLKPYLKNKKKVYLSLSGLLHQISMPSLTIDEPLEVEILTSTRTLVEDAGCKSEGRDYVVLMGDLNYDRTSKESSVSPGKPKSNLHFHRNTDSVVVRHNLPGTKREVGEISMLLKNQGISAELFSGDEGTEEAFRNIGSLNPDIIHLATHGFYYPRDNSVVMMDQLFGIGDYLSDIENPMLRSGLLFSGDNGIDQFPLNEDGIITANEIAAMDFSGVNLVVLSACETGLGDVLGSEGVFGLQRAFKMAGVEKLIVSLWKIPDQATSELMISFYEHYLAGGNIHNSLNQAQLDTREKYPEPFYWAGFFAVE